MADFESEVLGLIARSIKDGDQAGLRKSPEDRAAEELAWLIQNPHFRERPASIKEFIAEDYLNIESGVRKAIVDALEELFGPVSNNKTIALYEDAIISGGIGTGKTTIASIILSYMTHWVLCLKDPQGYFGLLPGSRIAFMLMSTTEKQAREVIFSDIKARIEHSPWFKKFPREPRITLTIKFPGDIHIIPGDSKDTTFEGYNILAGVIDEIDSHLITAAGKDYAAEGYNVIKNRITSRFGNVGLLVLIGQMKKSSGFAATMYDRFTKSETAYAKRMTIWESFGWDDPRYQGPDGKPDVFYFDTRRLTFIPRLVAETMASSSPILKVPTYYRKYFIGDPERALKDLAGIPPLSGAPYIRDTGTVDTAETAWRARYGKISSPIDQSIIDSINFAEDFELKHPTLPRAVHVDIAYSSQGDALAMAMGYVAEMVETDDGELAPLIVFDFLARVKAIPGREIDLATQRKVLFTLRDKYHAKIRTTTLDGFQSVEWMQAMNKKRMPCSYLSVDRTMAAYSEFKAALVERRIEFPEYATKLTHMADGTTPIVMYEVKTLVDTGKKVDHLSNGSKDLLDTMAGVTFSLTDNEYYRRKARTAGGGRKMTPISSGEKRGPGSVAYPGSPSYDVMRNGGMPGIDRMRGGPQGALGSIFDGLPIGRGRR